MNNNPLLIESTNPYGAPSFDKIEIEHYKPAFEESIARARREVEAIINSPEEPTFKNTVEALQYAGRDLTKVASIFYNLNHCITNDRMQQIAQEISPVMTEYNLSIILNEKLFERIKKVYQDRDQLNLNHEELRILEKTYKSFSRNGANLSIENKEKYSKIAEQLSLLSLDFNDNLLAATNDYTLVITDEAKLVGLPQFVKDMAAHEAKQREKEGWVFTLHAPSYGPFLKYCDDRRLREEIWMAYNTRCVEKFDNQDIIKKLVGLRLEEANLLGYDIYADYIEEDNMAKNSETVISFIKDLADKSLPFAKKDVKMVADYAGKMGFKGELMPWDFSYYSNKYMEERYALNDEMLKPYFELASVEKAVFGLANDLYGLEFRERVDIPVYHSDVKVFEVLDNNRFMALLYMDYFPRESKGGGAWMTSFREQGIYKGEEERPFVSVVCNFTKPTETDPSLLTFYEVTTLLHEFGHALHGILAEGTYSSITGTNVPRDFVELPSQIMENWALEPEFLSSFAKHYKTGEVIPQDLIDKIIESKNYLAGYNSIRQLIFGTIDIAWHTISSLPQESVIDFEHSVIREYSVLPIIDNVIFSPSFSHIFSGGYAAGYYSYKWSEVLEADAFSLFKERGIFNKEVAKSFRENILSKGNIYEADVLYRNFRGRDPRPDALLEKSGLKL